MGQRLTGEAQIGGDSGLVKSFATGLPDNFMPCPAQP
jgi:hypothetical protein